MLPEMLSKTLSQSRFALAKKLNRKSGM